MKRFNEKRCHFIKNVSYSYDKKNDVIKNVSLDIEKESLLV